MVASFVHNYLLILLDIYIAVVSSAHNVCPKGYYIAIVSTIAETSANHHLELAAGFERLGRIEEKFMVSPCMLLYTNLMDSGPSNSSLRTLGKRGQRQHLHLEEL